MKKLCYHIHSRHSYDCLSKPADIVKEALRQGAEILAVTDHDTWRGSLEARDQAPAELEVVIGGEYLTDCGDLVALNLAREPVAREAFAFIDEVHEMGGWVVLPHPFQSHRMVQELAARVDAIEGFNARCSAVQNEQAEALVAALGKPNLAAADAHFLRHISCAINQVELNPAGFPWRIVGRETKPSGEIWHHASQMVKGMKRQQWRPIWAGGKGLIKSAILKPLGLHSHE